MSIRNQLLQDILSAIGGGGSVLWGSITGNIADQTDLAAVAKTNDYNDLDNKPAFGAIITTMNTRAAMGNTVSDTGVLQAVLTGTGDAFLPPPSTPQPETGGSYNGYVRVGGLVQIAASGELSVSSGALVIGSGGAGNYRAPHAWVGMSSSATATTVGFVFGIVKASDGLIHFSQRVTGGRMSAQDDLTNVSGGGFVDSLEPGDTLSMWVAADKTATVTIYDMNIGLEMSIAESLK